MVQWILQKYNNIELTQKKTNIGLMYVTRN